MADERSGGGNFLEPGTLLDGDLELVLVERQPGDPAIGWVPM